MTDPHILIVEPFDPDDDTDRFDIEHPADCSSSERYDGRAVGYDCGVAAHADEGLDTYFIHADDPEKAEIWGQERVPTGRHEIEPWQTHHVGGPWGADEWSGGLRLVEGPT